MIFAKRDLKDVLGISLSQRFANQIGRYLTASDDNQIVRPEPIEIPACYALLGENPENIDYDLEKLKHTIQQIISNYHSKTGYWLNQEQVAFAAAWQDAKQQATTLKERFSNQNIPHSTLHGSTPPLPLAFLADALQIKQFSIPTAHDELIKPTACSRKINLSLDGTNMTELESIGREIRECCEEAYLKQGVNLEDMQSSWRLHLRYADCEHGLILKCMPKEMLREVFETQHFQKYGTTHENRCIVIDELEIEVRLADTTPIDTPKTSFYVEQWLTQWKSHDEDLKRHWSKLDKPNIQDQYSWLHCSVLEGILTKLITKQADSTLSGFFLTNHQKDVDEVVTRN